MIQGMISVISFKLKILICKSSPWLTIFRYALRYKPKFISINTFFRSRESSEQKQDRLRKDRDHRKDIRY